MFDLVFIESVLQVDLAQKSGLDLSEYVLARPIELDSGRGGVGGTVPVHPQIDPRALTWLVSTPSSRQLQSPQDTPLHPSKSQKFSSTNTDLEPSGMSLRPSSARAMNILKTGFMSAEH